MMLQGEKIYLKKNFSEKNYPLLLNWFEDLDVVGYLYSAKRISNFKTIKEVKDFLVEEKDEIFWEIYTKQNNFVGYTSLSNFKDKQCEFSLFILDKQYWRMGIGLEAAKIILNYAFNELKMEKVILETSELHYKAVKLYEKLGFRKAKIVPKDRIVFHDGEWKLSGSLIMVKD